MQKKPKSTMQSSGIAGTGTVGFYALFEKRSRSAARSFGPRAEANLQSSV
jgi:hypothetical protein